MFGSKFLGGNIWGVNSLDIFFFIFFCGGGGGGKWGHNFFLKQIFLGGNFRDQVLEERSL